MAAEGRCRIWAGRFRRHARSVAQEWRRFRDKGPKALWFAHLPGPLHNVARSLAEYRLTLILGGVAPVLMVARARTDDGSPGARPVVAMIVVLTVGIALYASVQANRKRSPGYRWIVPIATVVGVVGIAGGGAERPLLTVAAGLLALGAALARVAFPRLTATWSVTLATGAALVLLLAFLWGDGYTSAAVALLLLLPLLALPYICANTRMRTAVISMVAVALIVVGILAAYGRISEHSAYSDHDPTLAEACTGTPEQREASRPEEPAIDAGEADACCAGTTCSEMDPIALAQEGLAALVSELTEWPVRPRGDGDAVDPADQQRSQRPAITSNLALALVAVYLYGCYRLLQINRTRLRTTVDVRFRDDAGDPVTTPDSGFQEVLLTGTVSIGSAQGDVASEPLVSTTISSLVPAATSFARLFDRLHTEPPVRATVTLHDGEVGGPGALDGGRAVTLTLEHPQEGKTILVQRYDRPVDLLKTSSPARRAGYSVLSHCLSARGLPAWSSWSLDGEGLGVWFEVRRGRNDRMKAARARGRAAWQDAEGDAAEERARTDVHEECVRIQEALSRHDPKALLLILELGSRYAEGGHYGAAAEAYLRAVNDYPEFPETWLRLSLVCTRLGIELGDEGSPRHDRIHPRGGPRSAMDPSPTGAETTNPALLDRLPFTIGSRSGAYRRFVRRLLDEEWMRRQTDGAPRYESDEWDRLLSIEWHFTSLHRRLQDPSAASGVGRARQHHLAQHYLHLGLACAEIARRRLYRPTILGRALAIQSEREVYWRLLTSRFALRRLMCAARAAEMLALVHLCTIATDGAPDDVVEANRARFRQSIGAVDRSVWRQGTGWRAPRYLHLVYARLADEKRRWDEVERAAAQAAATGTGTGTGPGRPAPRRSRLRSGPVEHLWGDLTIHDIERRLLRMDDRARRRCLAERGCEPAWIEGPSTWPAPLLDRPEHPHRHDRRAEGSPPGIARPGDPDLGPEPAADA